MCGSCKVLHEAAMMAADVAPVLLPEKNCMGFGFTHWKLFDAEKWQAIVQQAEDRKNIGMQKLPAICGSDNSEILVGIARSNIEVAGFSSAIKVSLQDATNELYKNMDFRCQRVPGLIVTNPPYGKRIGQVQLLRTLYHRFGLQLKSDFNGWTAVIITSEDELAKSIGLRAFRKNMLFNGGLKSTLYQYHINESVGKAAKQPEKDLSPVEKIDKQETDNEVRQQSGAQEKGQTVSEHGLMCANRRKKSCKHRQKWTRKNDFSCYSYYFVCLQQ